jgi:uncharacterized membrane protein YeiH
VFGELFRVLDLSGVFTNAILGGIVARDKRLDPVGFAALALLSGLGGGIIRDTLLGRLAVVLEREIYASAALLGSLLVVLAHHFHASPAWATWPGLLACFGLRPLSLRFGWNMPRFGRRAV